MTFCLETINMRPINIYSPFRVSTEDQNYVIEQLLKVDFTSEQIAEMSNNNWSNLNHIEVKGQGRIFVVEILPEVIATTNLNHYITMEGWQYVSNSDKESIRTMPTPKHRSNQYLIYDPSTYHRFKR